MGDIPFQNLFILLSFIARLMRAKRGSAGLSRQRRGQLTAFILLGIVILAVFGFMYMISSSLKRARMEKEIDVAAERIRETEILARYVRLCLKNGLKEGLTKAGDQGGRIYFANPDEHAEHKQTNVGYGILAQDSLESMADDPELPEPPEYPCINNLGTDSYSCEAPYNSLIPSKLYPFGIKALPPLCSPTGPNAANLEIFPYPCPTGTYGPGSVQQHLKTFVESSMAGCLDEESIESMENVTQMGITPGEPNVTVMLGEDDIIGTASFPLNISLGDYGSTRFFDFEVGLPVRLKKMFGLAKFIAEREAYNISFNATRDYADYRYFSREIRPQMKVARFRAETGNGVDDDTDIIRINDSISIIEGEAYEFMFAVQNMIPALEPIPEPVEPGKKFDIVVSEGEKISISPQGRDPDDTDQPELDYGYEGWKGDEDASFSPSMCFSDIEKCKQEPYWAVDIENSIDPNVWEDSEPYTDPQDVREGKNAEYETKTKDENPVPADCEDDDAVTCYSRDLGGHNVTVKVCDESGKCDWQTVRVLVIDTPSPTIDVNPPYGADYASVEDPFVLDASRSAIWPGFEFEWTDSKGDFTYTSDDDNDGDGVLEIPLDIDIRTIHEKAFQTQGEHTLTLTIPGGSPESADYTLKVKECLPFDHDPGLDHAPYPYNDNSRFNNPRYAYNPETNANPFVADHACCDSYEYVDKTDLENPCYIYKSYGSYLSFDKEKFKTPALDFTFLQNDDDSHMPNNEKKNDIFWRHFERYCSGDRGNICSGDATQKIEVFKACADEDNDFDLDYGVEIGGTTTYPNANIEQTERCMGPPKNYRSANTEVATTTPGSINCINYGAALAYGPTTFEQYYDVGSSQTGKCSDTPACSSGEGDDTFGVGGPFRCGYALCDGDTASGDDTHCDVGKNCACDEECGAEPACGGISYNAVVSGDESAYSSTSSGERIKCGSQCQAVEPDKDENACVWVVRDMKPSIATPNDRLIFRDAGNLFGVETPGMGNCCGDDNNEYYIEGFQGTTAACCNSLTDCVYNGECISSGQRSEHGPLTDKQEGVCKDLTKKCSDGVFNNGYIEIPGFELIESSCDDGLDNNCNGKTDMDDPDCQGGPGA